MRKVYIPLYGLITGKGCGLNQGGDAWGRALEAGPDAEHPVDSPWINSVCE